VGLDTFRVLWYFKHANSGYVLPDIVYGQWHVLKKLFVPGEY